MTVDAIVVGGGPAGLGAALWLGRYRRSVTVVDSGEYRGRWTEVSHGYLTRDRTSPTDLLAAVRAELEDYPTVALRPGRAVEVQPNGDGDFVVVTEDERLAARRLVLATGVVDAFPDVEGFFDHYGASVFHCPSCDGYEARDRTVVAFGWNENLAAFALGLLDWAASVSVVTPPGLVGEQTVDCDLVQRLGVRVVEGVPKALEGARGDLRCVRLTDGRRLRCDLAFFSIEHHPVADLADQLGCRRDADGYVAVDTEGRTSVEGVFAAGDLTPGTQLVQIAAAQGVAAGIACALSLQGLPAAAGAPAPAPDVQSAVEATEEG